MGFKEDYEAQATILEKVYLAFTRKPDKIKALERLCLILKKRVHKNLKLQFYLGEIKSLDPLNSEILRYKREELIQEKRFDDLIEIYTQYLDKTKEKKKRYLRGLELANLLYAQLGDLEGSKAVLDKYCHSEENSLKGFY